MAKVCPQLNANFRTITHKNEDQEANTSSTSTSAKFMTIKEDQYEDVQDWLEEKFNIGNFSESKDDAPMNLPQDVYLAKQYGLKMCSVNVKNIVKEFPQCLSGPVNCQHFETQPSLDNNNRIPVKVGRGLKTVNSRKKLECPKCHASVTKKLLKKHLQTHLPPNERSFKCKIANCQYGSACLAHLRTHMASKHGMKKYLLMCAHCKYSHTRRCNLKSHIFNNHIITRKCNHPGCNYSTTRNVDWKIHTKTHLPWPTKKSYQCSHLNCGFTSLYQVTLQNHLAKKHGEKKYLKECPCCDYQTSRNSDLKKHIETHLPQNRKTFQCPYTGCSYSGAQKVLLTAHLAHTHAESNLLTKCPQCDYSSISKHRLALHRQTHLPQSQKRFQCSHNDCTYAALEKKGLLVHLARKHAEGNRLNKCPHCTYTSLYSLKQHIGTHREEKLRKCTHAGCKYSAPNLARINAHLANKHQEKEHIKICPHCPFKTGYSQQLKAHIQKHLPGDKKTFKCSYPSCGHNTTTKAKLTLHLAIKHNETKNVKKCPHCSYCTLWNSQLQIHIETHSRKKPTICCKYADCNFTCVVKRELAQHLHQKHGKGMELKKCAECVYTTLYSLDLKKHIQRHLPQGERTFNFKCDFPNCGFSDWERSRLNAHRAKIHGETKHLKKCPYCRYKAVRSDYLKRHIANHLRKGIMI